MPKFRTLPTMHALSEEEAFFAEPARREPKHQTTHVYRRANVMKGEGMIVLRARTSERAPSDYVGSTRNVDRMGEPNYGGGRQVKGLATDEVAARRAKMGNATPDGQVKLASW